MTERLIDANALHAKIMKDHDNDLSKKENIAQILLRIETAPTIEPKPVRHGQWIERRYGNWKDDIRICSAKCSECKRYAYQMKTLVVWFDADFCPNCGARMDGKSTLGSEANGCWISCAECANTGCRNRYVQEVQEDE